MGKRLIQPMKVLSIDFDYFQVVPRETLFHYPDGHDHPTELSTFVWVNHYASPYDEKLIREVTVNNRELSTLKKILKNNVDTAAGKVMIANSHKHIYDFVKKTYERYSGILWTGVDLVNVDMHHDMFNDNPNLDCGNWVIHLKKAIPNFTFSWIANPVSTEAYGFGENIQSCLFKSLDAIKSRKFDLIFLCRSDCWTPPHLDSYFDDLYQFILKTYGDVLVDNQITKPRVFEDLVVQQKELFAEFNSRQKLQEAN